MERVLYKGKLKSHQIKIVSGNSPFSIPGDLREKVEKLWKQEKRKAKEKRAELFNSKIYRLEELNYSGKDLSLTLGTLPYSFQKITKYLINEIIKQSKDYYPNGLFTTSLILTKDGKYVFGNRGKTMSKNKKDMIGGVLSKQENIVRNGKDIFKAIIQELHEEINVDKEHIREIYLSGVISTNLLKVGLLFYVELNFTSSELQRAFLHRKDKEMNSLVFINKRRLKSFLISLGGYKTIVADEFLN